MGPAIGVHVTKAAHKTFEVLSMSVFFNFITAISHKISPTSISIVYGVMGTPNIFYFS